MGLGQAKFPGHSRVLEAGERRGARSPVVAGNEHDVGMGFGHACGDRTYAYLGDQLDMDPCTWVRVFQVVDQLCEILDGVDVVVRRRGDQWNPRR